MCALAMDRISDSLVVNAHALHNEGTWGGHTHTAEHLLAKKCNIYNILFFFIAALIQLLMLKLLMQ